MTNRVRGSFNKLLSVTDLTSLLSRRPMAFCCLREMYAAAARWYKGSLSGRNQPAVTILVSQTEIH